MKSSQGLARTGPSCRLYDPHPASIPQSAMELTERVGYDRARLDQSVQIAVNDLHVLGGIAVAAAPGQVDQPTFNDHRAQGQFPARAVPGIADIIEESPNGHAMECVCPWPQVGQAGHVGVQCVFGVGLTKSLSAL